MLLVNGSAEVRRKITAFIRDALASLGPVAVKVGQTLSQRPDLVGEEACDAWYYGEDPTKEKVAYEVDEVKMAALRAEGEARVARRAVTQAAQEAARRATGSA